MSIFDVGEIGRHALHRDGAGYGQLLSSFRCAIRWCPFPRIAYGSPRSREGSTRAQAGLVHRDVQAGQRHDLRRGEVKIFGFCRGQNASWPIRPLNPGDSPNSEPMETRVGVVMGTPMYMAPEAWPWANPVDGRSDQIYLGRGALAYELLQRGQAANHGEQPAGPAPRGDPSSRPPSWPSRRWRPTCPHAWTPS